jgi:peptide deformylase
MAVREIVTLPAPILRRKARPVTEFGAELQTLINDMIDTMRDAPGVGLAAPQVDVPLRLIVVEYSEEDEDEDEDKEVPPKLYVVANPEITRFSSDDEIGTEGCLSIPGYAGDVERPLAITIKGLNRRGQPLKLKAEGWLARIFQHEIDHLDGVLFIDRAEKVWKHEGQTSQASVSE